MGLKFLFSPIFCVRVFSGTSLRVFHWAGEAWSFFLYRSGGTRSERTTALKVLLVRLITSDRSEVSLHTNINNPGGFLQARDGFLLFRLFLMMFLALGPTVEISARPGIAVFNFWWSSKGTRCGWRKLMNFHAPPPVLGCGCHNLGSFSLSYYNLSSEFSQSLMKNSWFADEEGFSFSLILQDFLIQPTRIRNPILHSSIFHWEKWFPKMHLFDWWQEVGIAV